jgi:hypothetical protein
MPYSGEMVFSGELQEILLHLQLGHHLLLTLQGFQGHPGLEGWVVLFA